VRVGDVGTGGHLERDDLEARGALPGEEVGPDGSVGVDPADAVGWRRYVEQHDVLGVVGQNRIDVPLVHRHRPALDQGPDLSLFLAHGSTDRHRGPDSSPYPSCSAGWG
jgi:hypothetical protein